MSYILLKYIQRPKVRHPRSAWERLMAATAVAAAATCLMAQSPVLPPRPPDVGVNATVSATPTAITRSRMDPEKVKRGAGYYSISCAECHGATAKGTNLAPDLIRSTLVEDDEGKGELLAPVLHEGRPDKGMPRPNLTDAQASDIVAWLFAQVYAAGTRSTYAYQNIVVGDARKGQAYFDGAGGCTSCHSVTGDLAGISAKYEPPTLQSRIASGGGGGRGGGLAVTSRVAGANGFTLDQTPPVIGRGTPTVSVRLASGQTIEGVVLSVDDFDIAIRDLSGQYHSWTRAGEYPKIEFHNPLQRHGDIARQLTDEQMHDLTAYLVTLK
jgi:mono/diheme cytochrome c family protein